MEKYWNVIEYHNGIIVRKLENLKTSLAESEYFKLCNTNPVLSGCNVVKMIEIN